MPHCIKGAMGFQTTGLFRDDENMGAANRYRGYHLIIYGFRPINHPTNKEQ
jgi:hypothetical protein